MTKTRNPASELNPVQREAVAWVQHLISGRAIAEDAEALKRWRAQSAAHAVAFTEASRAWNDVEPAGRSLRHSGAAMTDELAGLRRQMMSRRAVMGGGLATAAAAAYAVVYPPLGLWPSLSELRADYRTGTGEQRTITFADSVSIRMNTQTSIALKPADREGDRVELIVGEASFATTAQAVRSLIVVAGTGRILASAARFDVRRKSGGEGHSVCVTCLEGSVRIEHGVDAAALLAGQQLSYDANGLDTAAAVDTEIASDWQRGIVVFRGTPLVQAVEEINRYRPGRIVLMNAAIAQKRVNGRFRIDQMNEILTRLEQAFNARIHALPGGIILLS